MHIPAVLTLPLDGHALPVQPLPLEVNAGVRAPTGQLRTRADGSFLFAGGACPVRDMPAVAEIGPGSQAAAGERTADARGPVAVDGPPRRDTTPVDLKNTT